MSSISHPAGSVCWVDLGTPRPEQAAAFYSALFGWEVGPADADGYRIAHVGGRAVAGLGPGGSDAYWTVNIAVEDVEASASRILDGGGHVLVPPSTAGPWGRYAVTRSPGGLPVSLWQAGTRSGFEISSAPGSLAGVELRAPAAGVEVAFLEEVFAWGLDGAGTFRCQGRPVARLVRGDEPTDGARRGARAPRWVVGFAARDIATLGARVSALNGIGPGQDPDPPAVDGPALLVRDDQGVEFGLSPVR